MQPESSYEKVSNTTGIIITHDGHPTSAESIMEAISDGMKHFYDVETGGAGDYIIVCSKNHLNESDLEDFA